MQLLISENAESSVLFRPEFGPRPKSKYDRKMLFRVLNVCVKILPAIRLIAFSKEANLIFSRAVSGYC